MSINRIETIEQGGLLSVAGLRGAGVACGLKPSGGRDLALIVANQPRPVAGVFTRNALPAAPVIECRERIAREPRVRALVVNAGNANAMTGRRGIEDARAMIEHAERSCGGPALVLSTGVIGVPLPMEIVRAGIDRAAGELGSEDAGAAVAEAIMTTDTRPKTHAVKVALPEYEGEAPVRATVGGVAKGSGMIHPDMATMLAVVATDVPVRPETLDGMLRRAVEVSFHEITVDGDTSTNDAVLLWGGAGDGPPVTEGDPRLSALEAGVTEVMQQLAAEIVRDGEGASRVMVLRVRGAADHAQARRVADSVTRSSLVKTALAGGDPNWGRILAAAANAGVPLELERMTLDIEGIRVHEGGLPLEVEQRAVDAAFSREEVIVELDLGQGEGVARRMTSDLTQEYVRINAEYTT
jgi:glutamate N-acetyltransferase/amino-acid N-acetyltransferase